MIQIGAQPLPVAFGERPPPDPEQAIGGLPGGDSRLAEDSSAQALDGVLFVSPPPLPFPRVFPGL
ncbi:hypothetical protein SAMN02990966_07239 [Rhodospirillales bacterium URHD0017]|nr:hypothetical protein SAMN02990966_07239 [Rhodospirillales bacterium URHD0017]